MQLRIRELRKARGMSRRELAEAAHCSASGITKYETGRHWPRLDIACFIARALGVAIDDLLIIKEGKRNGGL